MAKDKKAQRLSASFPKQSGKAGRKASAPVAEPDVEINGMDSAEDSGADHAEESGSEGEEEEDEAEVVDEEGMERLMKALGSDGLDDIAKAQLTAFEEDDDEEEEEEGSESEEDGDVQEVEDELSGVDEDEDAEEEGEVEDEHEEMELEVDSLDSQPKTPVDNKLALMRIRETIQLDPKLPWTETLVTNYPETLDAVDPNDDLNREVAFYKQALHCAQHARSLAQKHSLPFTRPDDYFAEMVKSDLHMERIRTKLLDETSAIKKSEDAKRQRNLKKFGKQIQIDRLKERAKDKRDMLEQVKSLKRKRGGVDSLRDDGDFDIALDDTDDRPPKRGTASGRGRGRGKDGRARMPREARDSKYRWGHKTGTGKHAKSNTRESTDNYEFGGARRGGGKFGGRGGSSSRGKPKRLGKSRRNK